MWSPLSSSHLYLKITFSWSVIGVFIWTEPLLRGHLSYKATFSLSQRWPLNTGTTVYININFYLHFKWNWQRFIITSELSWCEVNLVNKLLLCVYELQYRYKLVCYWPAYCRLVHDYLYFCFYYTSDSVYYSTDIDSIWYWPVHCLLVHVYLYFFFSIILLKF
jgi:hypothetical protein